MDLRNVLLENIFMEDTRAKYLKLSQKQLFPRGKIYHFFLFSELCRRSPESLSGDLA